MESLNRTPSTARQIDNQNSADAFLREKQWTRTRRIKAFSIKKQLLFNCHVMKRVVINMLCLGFLANNRKLLTSSWHFRLACFLSVFLVGHVAAFASDTDVELLFLGDQKGHKPSLRFRIIEPVMAERGIKLSYTEDVDKLNAQSLSNYDGLMLYANIDTIEPSQAKACLLYTSPSPRDKRQSRMPSSA